MSVLFQRGIDKAVLLGEVPARVTVPDAGLLVEVRRSHGQQLTAHVVVGSQQVAEVVDQSQLDPVVTLSYVRQILCG